MKNLILLLSMTLLSTGVLAKPNFIIKTEEVKSTDQIEKFRGSGPGGFVDGSSGGRTAAPTSGDSSTVTGGVTGGAFPDLSTSGTTVLDRIGSVISQASNVVVLGESIYTLVQHGKPSNTTEYAPISVVPKDPMTKEIVSPFDMEDCSMPKRKNFITTISSLGKEVVRFEYMVVYVYNCSYEGTGKYIQTAIIQPVSVKTNYGWDFNASMLLSGIMNHGKKLNPNVGLLLTIKYSMKSWSSAFEDSDTVHIRGTGELESFRSKTK